MKSGNCALPFRERTDPEIALMLCTNKVPANVPWITDRRVSIQQSREEPFGCVTIPRGL